MVGLGPVGRDLHRAGPRRRPMVPKRLPWVQTASAQPATTASMSSGRASVVKSRSPPSLQAVEHGVPDDAADQVELPAGPLETGRQLGGLRHQRLEALGDHSVSG